MDSFQIPVTSNPATQFTQAIAQNEISQNTDLALPSRVPYWRINAITITALQNLIYELWLFSTAANLAGALATDGGFIGVWQFSALASGGAGYTVTPVGGSADPLFHYYIDGLAVPYIDRDYQVTAGGGSQGGSGGSGGAFPQVHCRLANRSATGKNADATGALIVTLHMTPLGCVL